jgi:hypothetical protein
MTTLDVPGATETDIFGVNDSGIITGSYNDSSNIQHGFVGVPAPGHGVDRPPVVTASDTTLASATASVAMSSLFTASDPDGDAITMYRFWDGTADPNSGHVVVNGVAQGKDTYITVTPQQLAQTTFQPGTVSDQMWVQANDGSQWGNWTIFNINPPGPPVVTANNQSVAAGQQVALSSLFSVGGNGISQYKVWFSYPEGGLPAVGTLTNNGTPIAPDQWVTLSSLSGWEYTGSAGSGTDRIWLQAYNGQWSEAFASITDTGATLAGHSSASQVSGLGNEQGGLDHTVSLLSQYMASSSGSSDFGSTDPVADPKGAYQNQPSVLAPTPLTQSHA